MSCADRSRSGRLAMVAVLTAALGLSEAPMAAMAGVGWSTLAQAPRISTDRPVTLRGTVVSYASPELPMTTAAGPEVVRLVAPLVVTGAVRASLADIGPGTFLGTAARAQADGTFRALELHIFPEAMRGTGEGHRPMETPGTTMTNANVDAVVQQADGPLLTLRHKDGVTQVVVPPDAPIVRFTPGDPSLLVPGASLVVFRAIRAADGTVSASRLTVGVNGVRLPM